MHNSPLLTNEELAALRSLPTYDEDRDFAIHRSGHLEPHDGGMTDPVGYWRRQAEVEASNARDARMHVRQLRKEMKREEWRAFQFGWALVLTWGVVIALAWTGAV